MSLKSIVLAGATLLSLAAPAAAMAQPYWDHDRGYHEGWRDRDDGRRREWREHERWEHGGGYYAPRCFIENRGYYNWYGTWVYRPVRVCR